MTLRLEERQGHLYPRLLFFLEKDLSDSFGFGAAGGSIARLIFGFSRVWARFLKEKGVLFMFYYSPKLDFSKRLGD